MNLASWVILAVVVAVVALALRATLSGKASGCGCHDAADGQSGCPSAGCSACSACHDCVAAKFAQRGELL